MANVLPDIFDKDIYIYIFFYCKCLEQATVVDLMKSSGTEVYSGFSSAFALLSDSDQNSNIGGGNQHDELKDTRNTAYS